MTITGILNLVFVLIGIKLVVLILLLTSLCPQPGSVAAAPPAEEGREAGVQTHSQVAVCVAGVALVLECAC